jgi:predicted metal-binding membrane protein
MIAMTLPTAAPLILLYVSAMRRNADVQATARRVYALAAGYVLVWTLFGVAATALQKASCCSGSRSGWVCAEASRAVLTCPERPAV